MSHNEAGAPEEESDIIYCQSCGMPVAGEMLLGTEADGSRSPDFCCYCYENGEFVDPELTREEMAERGAEMISQELTMSKEPAREFMDVLLPRLKRWRAE